MTRDTAYCMSGVVCSGTVSSTTRQSLISSGCPKDGTTRCAHGSSHSPPLLQSTKVLLALQEANNMIHIERCYGPLLRVLVHNLSLNTKNSQLQQLFGKYNKVYSAKVIYHKKTNTSHDIGLVTIATMHVCQDDASRLRMGWF